MSEPLFLSGADIEDLAEPEAVINAVRDGFRQRGEGAPAVPRYRLRRNEPSGLLTGYSAILPETGAMGGYIYSAGFEAGDAWFLTMLFDADTGAVRAVLDGAAMNPAKTGAVGAVGVDALARPDASSLGLIGSGHQARSQLRMAAIVRDLEHVRIYSPTPANRQSLARLADEYLAADVDAVDSSSAAVTDADIVITATTATEPVIDGDDLSAGTHVTAMGQYHPERRELDARTVARSTYVPDLRERAFQDAGAFLQAIEEGAIDESHIHAELGEIIAGRVAGRTDRDAITVFDSGGTGIETVATADLLARRASAAGRGTTIAVEPASRGFDRDAWAAGASD